MWVETLSEGTTEWEPLMVPYRITYQSEIFREINVLRDRTFSLLPGTELVFEQGAGIEANEGSLQFLGQPDEMIVLRGLDDSPGYWKGVFADSSEHGTGSYSLSHVELAHAGSGEFNSNGDVAAVVVWANTAALVVDSYVHDNAGQCAIVAYDPGLVSVAGTVFENNPGDTPPCPPE